MSWSSKCLDAAVSEASCCTADALASSLVWEHVLNTYFLAFIWEDLKTIAGLIFSFSIVV